MNTYEEIYHHGIKGQKWGVRRYQNADGRLTSAGKKRYSSSSDNEAVSETSKKRGLSKGAKTALLILGGAAAATAVGVIAAKQFSKEETKVQDILRKSFKYEELLKAKRSSRNERDIKDMTYALEQGAKGKKVNWSFERSYRENVSRNKADRDRRDAFIRKMKNSSVALKNLNDRDFEELRSRYWDNELRYGGHVGGKTSYAKDAMGLAVADRINKMKRRKK